MVDDKTDGAIEAVADPADWAGARIEAQDLTKNFDDAERPAVDGISLTVEAGEFMTFLGPSGSGKTTTLNMIAGLDDVSSGRILMDGKDIVRLPPYRRNLGLVFQNYALFPHMNAASNIAFPLRQRRIPSAQIATRVQDALDLVHLSTHGDRLPSQLSGGQQQRVALARAIVFQPRALLLDEPLGALDKKLRESLQLEIARLHRELGITFVFVTHDQEEALALSDRIAVFNDGRIEQVGTPQELYRTPCSRFVATFLGDSNVFAGTFHAGILSAGSARYAASAPTTVAGPAALIVRPEDLSLRGGPSDNSIRAVITDAVYQGAFRRVFVQFETGQVGQVREAASHATSVTIGDRVTVTWPASAGVVVQEEEGANP